MKRLTVVTPIFNDWESFSILLAELDRIATNLPLELDVLGVNDGSTSACPLDRSCAADLKSISSVDILHLETNLGHQRAIAIGLCVAVEEERCDSVLIMDADGEDSPRAIPTLIETAHNESDFCVVARRAKRRESILFRVAYAIYKACFTLLTGREIAFGNFCVISKRYARRLIHLPDLWNNLPAALLRSRLPILQIPVNRERRYRGESKMTFTSLVMHGFSGISVYAETIFVRLFFLSLALFFLSALSILIVSTLRIFVPRYATPGWATTVSFGVTILLVQTLGLTLSFILMLFNGRTQRSVIPIEDYKKYVERCETIFHNPRTPSSGE